MSKLKKEKKNPETIQNEETSLRESSYTFLRNYLNNPSPV
jgi:hypothetical protein